MRGFDSTRVKPWPFSLAVTGLLGITAIIGCNGPPPSSSADPASTPVARTSPAIQIVHPTRQSLRHVIEQPGFNIEPFQETPIYPKISGYIEDWEATPIDIGKDVRKGQILARLRVPELEAAVDQKRAAVRAAEAQTRVKAAAVLTARAQMERLQSQYTRLSRAGQQGVFDRDQVDEVRLGLQAAQAGLEQAHADVAAAEAKVEQAKADEAYARAMLGYATIRAPFNGVVTQRNINTDHFVQPSGVGKKDLPLYVIDQVDPVRVFVNVPASDAPWIRDGDAVKLRLQGAGGQLIAAKITRNARALDPRTRTLRTEIDVPNPGGTLLPGMYVQARISVEHPNTWTLPAGAVFTVGNQTYCYRVVAGKTVRTPLQLGPRGNGLIEVFAMQQGEGQWQPITGTEEVVASDPSTITNGQSAPSHH